MKGNAKKLIDGFNLEETNYDSAVKLLRSTYDNQRKQFEFALQLLHLKSLSHKADSLSEFWTELECILMKLENISCDLESSSWLS